MALRKLLGVDHLAGPKKTEVEVSKLEGQYIFLYFGAYWCPPCRQFTPILSKTYKNLKADKSKEPFEIVFISSDNSQDEFDEYFKDMPWLALPYSQRKIKEKLARKLKVSTLPTLAVIDKEGRVASTKVRQNVMQDREGKDFPWVPKSVWEILKGAKLTRSISAEDPTAPVPSVEAIRKDCDAIAMYFSAHYSPPCRALTPRLASVYRKLKAKDTKFEIILVPLDQNEEDFAEYFSEMPWVSLPCGDTRLQPLIEALDVKSMPSLVTIKADGTIINHDATEVADDDEDAALFPWAPQNLPPVTGLNPSPPVVSALNSDICVILSLNGAPNKTTPLAEFNKAAEMFTTEVNASLEPEERVRFLICDDADATQVSLYQKVLHALNAGMPKHGESTVMLMSLPNDRAFKFVTGELSAANIVARAKEFRKAQEV